MYVVTTKKTTTATVTIYNNAGQPLETSALSAKFIIVKYKHFLETSLVGTCISQEKF